MLYQLTIIDPELSHDSYEEAFSIGLYPSREEAEAVAADMLAHVPGFRDYPCTYRITEKEVSGPVGKELREVFLILGWNTNRDLDEIDLVESDCFPSLTQANAALAELQAQYRRSAWTIQRWTVGQADWSEGFVRD